MNPDPTTFLQLFYTLFHPAINSMFHFPLISLVTIKISNYEKDHAFDFTCFISIFKHSSGISD